MRWTILRPHRFMRNLLNEAGDISATGTFSLNTASGRIGMIDAHGEGAESFMEDDRRPVLGGGAG